MRGPTFPFAPMKTYDSISLNLREKLKLLTPHLSSPSCVSPPHLFAKMWPFFHLTFLFPSLIFFSFLLKFFFLIWTHESHCAMCPPLIWICFCPEKIYSSSVQLILTKLSSSHFLTSEIFVKISSLESLATYHSENRKNIMTVSEFDETFLGH